MLLYQSCNSFRSEHNYLIISILNNIILCI
nr:MAG TPA: hypothetical protein [Caudoviricetes sp.]